VQKSRHPKKLDKTLSCIACLQIKLQRFISGNLRKLIGTPSILAEIQELFTSELSWNQEVEYYIELLEILGQIQSCAKAEFLSR
jgi:hypothetical protein